MGRNFQPKSGPAKRMQNLSIFWVLSHSGCRDSLQYPCRQFWSVAMETAVITKFEKLQTLKVMSLVWKLSHICDQGIRIDLNLPLEIISVIPKVVNRRRFSFLNRVLKFGDWSEKPRRLFPRSLDDSSGLESCKIQLRYLSEQNPANHNFVVSTGWVLLSFSFCLRLKLLRSKLSLKLAALFYYAVNWFNLPTNQSQRKYLPVMNRFGRFTQQMHFLRHAIDGIWVAPSTLALQENMTSVEQKCGILVVSFRSLNTYILWLSREFVTGISMKIWRIFNRKDPKWSRKDEDQDSSCDWQWFWNGNENQSDIASNHTTTLDQFLPGDERRDPKSIRPSGPARKAPSYSRLFEAPRFDFQFQDFIVCILLIAIKPRWIFQGLRAKRPLKLWHSCQWVHKDEVFYAKQSLRFWALPHLTE
jgi:hypothetical protein